MKKAIWLNILKWIWFTAVIAAAVWYFSANFSDIRSYLSTIRISRVIIAVLLLISAKFLTADLTYVSLKICSQTMPFREAFTITSITQLGKYLPGGVWHFAGKFGVYQTQGMSAKEAARPMIIENLWLIASAVIAGISTVLLSQSAFPCHTIPFLCSRTNAILLFLFLLLFWIIAAYLIVRLIFRTSLSPMLHLRLSIEQLSIWFLFGCSFWLIFPHNTDLDFFLQAISAFSLSWALGYISFFAPGGIGIREATMILFLASFFPSESIAVFATIHRLLWVITEILLAVFSMALFGFPIGMNQSDKPEIIQEPGNQK
jgi:glycosyltransferase 2 family protein